MIFNLKVVAIRSGILILGAITVFIFHKVRRREHEYVRLKPNSVEGAVVPTAKKALRTVTEYSEPVKSWSSVLHSWSKQTPRHHLLGFAVPNIVHFIRFGESNLTFIDAVCILAAMKNQKPEKLIIHSDQIPFHGGIYWNVVTKHPLAGVIEVKYLPQPTKIFDQPLYPKYEIYHAGDIARLLVLMRYGGIYLDNDSYIVRSLDEFRYYEMTMGLKEGWMIANQVIIASRDARFLKIWYDSYRDYRHDWWYNAGHLPTELLYRQPYLVNCVWKGLGERESIPQIVYLERSDAWKSHYAIHLIIAHQYMIPRNVSENATYPVEFNETNILKYNVNIKDMVLDVYVWSYFRRLLTVQEKKKKKQ